MIDPLNIVVLFFGFTIVASMAISVRTQNSDQASGVVNNGCILVRNYYQFRNIIKIERYLNA